jgi:dihydroxyacetone kinase-like predicted kinase
VAILPGHRNAVATAHKTVDVAVAEGGRPLDVIEPATSPPAVLAALAVLDPAGPAEQVLADITAAAAAVRVGEVVGAVRDADTSVGPSARVSRSRSPTARSSGRTTIRWTRSAPSAMRSAQPTPRS